MAGYAIQARIDGVRPRLSTRASPDLFGEFAAGCPVLDDDPTLPCLPGAGTATTPTLAERWEQAGRVWSETTFFLFDPQSWR